MSVEIETISEYDIPEILALIQEYFPYVNMYFEALERRTGWPWIYYEKSMEKGVLTGFAEWEITDKQKKIARLNGIAVKPVHRGKGHADALLKSGEKWARKKGMKMLTLLVAETNTRAQQLYTQNGFEMITTYPRKIMGETSQVWEKKLA